MALPWLIGAAVLGVGAWIASSGDDDSSNNNGDDEERERRERAERERREREQKEERDAIKASLRNIGSLRADDLKQALSGWVDVNYPGTSPFKANVLATGKQYQRVVAEHFTDSHELALLDTKTRLNLNAFERCYEVELTMTEKFYDAVDELMDCQDRLETLQDYREQFERIRQHLRG